jgi:hypothetical protein
MKRRIAVVAGTVMAFAVAGHSSAAGGYQEAVERCLEKHANMHDAASVTLECDAQGGKLANCKVVENSAPAKGFDRAAMCVADALPMAGKTGSIKVPIRFPGEG